MNLENIQKLLSLVDQFKQVKRTINNAGQEEKENDAEHSYELAILSWFLATHLEPNLNLEKILLYSLVHDLVEAYAGDTNAFNQDDLATKELREHEALQTIQREFQFFPKPNIAPV
jgi:putative hydrolase of HD superfamily